MQPVSEKDQKQAHQLGLVITVDGHSVDMDKLTHDECCGVYHAAQVLLGIVHKRIHELKQESRRGQGPT